MPNITFLLPHWIYWCGLIAVPLFFLLVSRRVEARGAARGLSLPLAYFFWAVSGFMGIHRLYAKSWWAAVFIALFVGVILCNYGAKQTRNEHSIVKNEAFNAQYDLKKAKDEGEDDDVVAALEKDLQVKEKAEQLLQTRLDNWHKAAGAVALVILILMIIDFFMLPRIVNRARGANLSTAPPPEESISKPGAGEGMFERAVGKVNAMTGEFAAYWTVVAVFVFYYEVIARYIFNSPTIWAHESMFLMFGMQYLLAGGFCLREKAHVRVDVVYMHLSPRAKAVADLLTSVFFFIFAAALLVTGWIFFRDSYAIGQVSHTEWEIAHWPIKFALPLGGLLLLTQGLAALVADIRVLRAKAQE